MWVHGHAIVCGRARMTDATGAMPEALRFEADWALFQAALDRADVSLIGRRTHAAAPNAKRRRRVVVTRDPVRPLDDDRAVAFDPSVGGLRAFLAERFGAAAHVAVVGGTDVFDLAARALGYDAFTLTVAPAVRLDGGRPVFADSRDLAALERRLKGLGLARAETRTLAAAAPLHVEEWRRAA
jgi:dihydrofolate reductase